MLEIPQNATIRQEYVKCGNPDCQNLHGPYLYAYWKYDKKLNKRYVGKNNSMKELKNKVESFIIHDNKDAKSAENEIHKIKEDLIIEIIYTRG